MTTKRAADRTTAEAYLARLAERGVEYVFANAGTDFASIVEALATKREKFPRFIVVPHENVAVAMAHGYYRLAGKPAGVMVHVSVGTANTICGLMNAARDNTPILLAAGRTPLTERGHIGSRNRSIHWGQETFDQGGMVREFVKWDYELRTGQPAEAAVDRALDIAMSEPRGPVYLTLPREVLANPATPPLRETVRPLGAAAPVPSPTVIDEAADMIAGADFPLVLTSTAGRTPEGFNELSALAKEFAIPVVQTEARDINIPTSHPMHLGFNAEILIGKADVVVVIDSEVPWIPKQGHLNPKAKVIHISSDPLESDFPYREYETDLLVAGSSAAAMASLRKALRKATKGANGAIDKRRAKVAELRAEIDARLKKILENAGNETPVHPHYLAACINQMKKKDAIIVNELGIPASQIDFETFGSYLGTSLAGGLGSGLGFALGAKLAAPNREVIAIVGDGSYMFGNPVPAHFVGRAESLPTLTVVANNMQWYAVRTSTLDLYADGVAAKANSMPLTELRPSPDFEKVIQSCGGHGEKVEAPGDLVPAMKRALDAVRSGTPALLNVICQARR